MYPTRIRILSSTQDSSRNIGNRACVEVATLEYSIHGKESGSILLLHRIKKHIRIYHPQDSGFIAYSKISTLHSGLNKMQIHRMLEWTEAESGKKKLRIEKYVMETCRRGLNQVMEFNFLSRERKKNCRQLMLTYFFSFRRCNNVLFYSAWQIRIRNITLMWRRKLDRVPSSFPCLYKKITFEQKSADELWPIEIRNFSWSNRDL